LQIAEYLLAEPVVEKDYEFTIAECDVLDKVALTIFRENRRKWLVWLETDEHHAIWQVLYTMVWRDVTLLHGSASGRSDPMPSLSHAMRT